MILVLEIIGGVLLVAFVLDVLWLSEHPLLRGGNEETLRRLEARRRGADEKSYLDACEKAEKELPKWRVPLWGLDQILQRGPEKPYSGDNSP
jgi:hypothetical protein